jgi:serpin B
MDTSSTTRSEFATRLYDKLAGTHAGKNLFCSPFSIQVALAMCAVGANGETRRVLTDLIGAPESLEEQNCQYARLLKSIHGEGERPFQLATANALWGQEGYHFKTAFQEAIADFYDGALHEVNFRAQPDEAVKTINAWVSAKTREKIRELVKRDFINDDTRLILTNAIYFKGEWEARFQKSATEHEDWHGPHGTLQVPMMHRRGGYLYSEASGFQALDMPYKGRQLSMLVVLPKKQGGLLSLLRGRMTDGLAALERNWVAQGTHQQVTASLHSEDVIVSALN